jgi:hypothetical protein
MSQDYADSRIAVCDDGLRIGGYYFPVGVAKRVPLSAIKSVRRVNMGALTGRGRLWGTANPSLWANFDPKRPRKQVAFVIALGKSVNPFVTPDDPAAFEAALQAHGVTVEHDGRSSLI